jgi:hypothetical protein
VLVPRLCSTTAEQADYAFRFLALPVSEKGTLVQYASPLRPLHPGKQQGIIVDVVNSKVPMLARMFERRRVGYRAMGYREEIHGALLEKPTRPNGISTFAFQGMRIIGVGWHRVARGVTALS